MMMVVAAAVGTVMTAPEVVVAVAVGATTAGVGRGRRGVALKGRGAGGCVVRRR